MGCLSGSRRPQVISRPQLSSLTPGTTAFTTSLASSGAAPSVTIGNPYLSPFRATNLDFSVEKYFPPQRAGRGHAVQQAYRLVPRSRSRARRRCRACSSRRSTARSCRSLTGTIQTYTAAGGTWAIRQFQDAPGGNIKGFEVNLQTDFFFLPAPFDKFGVTANYTHIASKLSYLTGTALSTTQDRVGADRGQHLRRGAVPQHLARCLQRDALLREQRLVGACVGVVSQALRQQIPARDRHVQRRHHHQRGRGVQLAGGGGLRLQREHAQRGTLRSRST